jgi:hypothetical protein
MASHGRYQEITQFNVFTRQVWSRHSNSGALHKRTSTSSGSALSRRPIESGSALPLMIGLLTLSLFMYMAAIDVYSIRTSKMHLERLGEDLVTEVLKDISYQDYYFGDSYSGNSQSSANAHAREFVPVTCREVIRKLSQLAQNLPRNTKFLSGDCTMNRVNLAISKRVNLPFLPQALANFQPDVIAFVSGGLQRVGSN